jgi:D-arabinonate dehydratase/D-galactarolactone cycloisomerase
MAPLLAAGPSSRALAGMPPLEIARVEAIVIRSPKDSVPENSLVDVPPLGATTGGVGLWNRLDATATAYSKDHVQAALVKISTREGLTGWGQCHAPIAPRVHKTIVSDLFAPLLIGQDARNIEALWESLYSSQRLRGYGTGFFIQSVAGVDLALWDLLGKYTGLPVYRLLGGKFRDTVPTYLWINGQSPTAVAESARAAISLKFTALKMNMCGPKEIDLVAAASEAAGSKAQVFVVAVGLKLYEAVRIGRELDRLGNIGWLQEPLLPEDSSGYSKLMDAIDTPVCYGAFLGNRFKFRDVLTKGAIDILNPDICYCGGITESKRVAVLADAFGKLWSPHVSMGSPPYIAASIHLALATPNFVIMESAGQQNGPFGNVLLKEPLRFHDGYADAPERPGLGIDFNEEELARVTIS